MPATSHFNHRLPADYAHGGEPGGTNLRLLTPEQDELRRILMRRMRNGDAEGIAAYILNHTTLEEQAEALQVYRMAGVR